MQEHHVELHEQQDLIVSLAALMIHDAGMEVTKEKLHNVIHHLGVHVAPYWAPMMAANLEGKNIDEIIVSGPTTKTASVAATGVAAAAEEKKEEAKEEEKKEEEEEVDYGFGDLF